MSNREPGKRARRLPARLKALAKSGFYTRALIFLAAAVIMLGFFVFAITPVRYRITAGMVPQNTITATKDVVDEITTEKLRDEAAAAVTPTYKYQEGVTENVMSNFDQIFAQLRAVRQYGEMLPDSSPKRTYTADELTYARAMLTLLSLRDYQITTLLHATGEELETLYATLSIATQNTLLGHVTQGQEPEAVQSILMIVGPRIPTSLLQNVAQPLLNACVQANMVIDQAATDLARDEARAHVENVVYKQGQNIVVRGEDRVRPNQIAMLESLGLLSDGKVDMTIYVGAALLTAVVGVVLLLVLARDESGVTSNTTKTLLACIVLVLVMGLSVLSRLVNEYFTPIILCGMLLTAMISLRVGILCGAAVTLLCASLAAGGSEAYTKQMVLLVASGLLGGTTACLIINRNPGRARALIACPVVCAVQFAVFVAYGLMTDNALRNTITDALWSMGGCVMSVLLFIAFRMLLEITFNLPTPTRLMELSNPNQPLLRRLMLEAPGTYHHSIIVANLAEAAAEAIGANALLARVGGYYHDIGKLKRPAYFKENQIYEGNVHDGTDPKVSAAIVTAHVSDGAALARAHHLPEAVVDIISEHHGDTPVMYFYHKALQQSGGKPVDIALYRYDGHPPTTKESAIIMISDTVEAAVRTLKNPTPESIEDFIVKLVRGKLEDGQLADCPLTLRDIDRICAACVTVMVGISHERIEYPELQEAERQRLSIDRENESREGDLRVPQPKAEPMPVVSPDGRIEPMPVVEPEHVALPLTVEPPSVIAPVSVDHLIAMTQAPKPEEPARADQSPDAGQAESAARDGGQNDREEQAAQEESTGDRETQAAREESTGDRETQIAADAPARGEAGESAADAGEKDE